MKTNLEQELAKLKHGDHICSIFENTAEQLTAAIPFIIEGLQRGERCVYIVNDHTMEQVAGALAAAGVDVARERQRGALRLLTRQDTCVGAGEFAPQAMIEFIRHEEAEALAAGFSGLRQMGEMSWVLGPEPGCQRLIEFEALVNQLLANSKIVGLCHYNNSRFEAPCILEVLRTHPLAILGDQVCPNPYYEPPELVLARDQQASAEFKRQRVAWWIAQLKRARVAEQERARALEELQHGNNLLRAVIEGIPEMVFVKDHQGRYLLVNSETARFVGQPAQAILGRDDAALFEPETAKRFMEVDRRVIKTGRPETYEKSDAANGNHTYLTTKTPFFGPAGKIDGVLGISRDITEQKQAEEELKRQKMILQTIFDQIPVMVCFVDAASRVQLVNRHWQRVLGWSLEEAQSRDLLSEAYPDPAYRARVIEYTLHPTPGWTDFKVRARDGRTLDTSWAITVLPDGTRIGIGQDITERKQAEQAHERYTVGLQALSRRLVSVQEEERRQLARELHDEFGQILATITLHLHAALGLAGDAARPRLDECTKLLHQAGEQVRSLALELRPIMLDTLGLEATLHWLAEQHQQRAGYEVQVVGHLSGMPLSPELAIACFRLVQEALTNVVRHAAARHVWIELSQSDNVLELVVRDDGVGFDVAPTQEQAARRGSLGLLGMAERVQLMGGTLQVETEPGRGTRIRASFPLGEAPEEQKDLEE
jgi:PAS domain S-box-containing protein